MTDTINSASGDMSETHLAQVILCADDYAYDAEVSEAILALIEQQRLSATSCMVLSPTWKIDAKRLSQTHFAQADVGLHLDFTEFNDQFPQGLNRLLLQSHLRQLDRQSLKKSIIRQLDLFEFHLGRAPDFIDGHQHVHHLPQVRQILLQEAERRYANRIWIRNSSEIHPSGLKSHIIRHTGANALQNLVRKTSMKSNAQLLGIYDFNQNASAYLSSLTTWLEAAKMTPNTLIMCHPAKPLASHQHRLPNHQPHPDAIRNARYIEFEVLAGNDFSRLLLDQGVRLAKGSLLLNQ